MKSARRLTATPNPVERDANEAELLRKLLYRSDSVFIKKLSTNDRDWATNPNKHQAGPYIPKAERDGGFFLPLEKKVRTDGKPHEIRERNLVTFWPQAGDKARQSRLVNYRSKGEETHLTRLPKAAFAHLLPASFLVIGRQGAANEYVFECLTINSGSPEAALLADTFDLGLDFSAGVFEPSTYADRQRDQILQFIEQALHAWENGELQQFAALHTMPSTKALAQMAQKLFLKANSLTRLNPFALVNPGDALREISRSIEWDIFRDRQRKERSLELLRLVMGDVPRKPTALEVMRSLLVEFPKIDALLLSASQQRKARAGRSYELHMARMLRDGGIKFQMQAIIDKAKRSDFVLPSLSFMQANTADAATGMILSAKTTLRERWKQVEREKGAHQLFLTTVDENVPASIIREMASIGLNLVVPEGLKDSKQAEYDGHDNVLSFKELCTSRIKPHLAAWRT